MSFPSIDVISYRVEAERERQIGHFEALDTKAGIVMGFAGVLVAISTTQSMLVAAGRMFAILAAGWAGWSFLPRDVPVLDARRLRRYVRAELDITKLHILDTEVDMAAGTEELLRNKARRLIIALAHPAAAVSLIGSGILTS